MERRDFFRKLGIGVAALVAAPMAMAKAMESKSVTQAIEKWTHLVIRPVGECGLNVTWGFWDRSLTPEEINKFHNLLFEPADMDHLLKLMPVRPVDFWIDGIQLMKDGKII